MKKIIYKFIVILAISIFVLSLIPLYSLAEDTDPFSSADNFLDTANSKFGLNGNKLKDASDDIYNLFSSVGLILSAIVGVILGIRLMVIGASEDKAKTKEALIPYLVGTVVIFGAFGIWKILINTVGGL